MTEKERTYLSPAGVRELKEHRDRLLLDLENDKRLIAEQSARIQRLHERLEAAESQIVRYERVIDTLRDQRDRLRTGADLAEPDRHEQLRAKYGDRR